jgi:hypothetical protein
MTAMPTGALPKPLADLATATGAASGFPTEFVAVPGLSVLAAAMAGRAELELSAVFRVKPIIWTATSAPPGSGKTPGQQVATAPLRRLESLWSQAHQEAVQAHEAAVAALSKGSEPPPLPLRRRCLVGDATVEALAPIMLHNPGSGVLWEQSEIAAIVAGLDQYRANGKGAGRPSFLALWDGRPLQVDRVGRGSLHVPNPLLSVTGAVQPARLSAVLSGADGLGSRFLVAHLPDAGLALPRLNHRVDPAVIAGWDALIRALVGEPESCSPVAAGDPQVVRLSAGAKTAWDSAMRQLKRSYTDARTTGYGQQVIAKAPLQLARLALLLHVADHPDQIPREIAGETLERAAQVVASFVEAELALDVTEASAAADVGTRRLDEGVQTLIDWLRRRPGQVARQGDLVRAHVAGCRTADEVSRLLDRYGETYPGCVSEERLDGVSSGPVPVLVRAPSQRLPLQRTSATSATSATIYRPEGVEEVALRSNPEINPPLDPPFDDKHVAPVAPVALVPPARNGHRPPTTEGLEGQLDLIPLEALAGGPNGTPDEVLL